MQNEYSAIYYFKTKLVLRYFFTSKRNKALRRHAEPYYRYKKPSPAETGLILYAKIYYFLLKYEEIYGTL